MKPNTLGLFWSRVQRGPGCWLWQARLDQDGYGVFHFLCKTRKAHRIAFTQFFGAPDEALCVCHRCDVRACCNPQHLFLGTNEENTQDRQNKGRQATGRRTRPETRARGEQAALSVLTANQVEQIRELCTRGELRQRDIGELFGVTQGTVSKIKRRVVWTHVN